MFLSISFTALLWAYSLSAGVAPAAASSTPWPTDIWTALNDSVQGRLQRAYPFAYSCFDEYSNNSFNVTVQPNSQLCEIVQENYTQPEIRSYAPGAYMEVCNVVLLLLSSICAQLLYL